MNDRTASAGLAVAFFAGEAKIACNFSRKMKLLFSEARPDYTNYVFPYAVWAFPEAHETPADILAAGFLPSTPDLQRFYLCRHTRVALARYAAASENRRILRKGEGLDLSLLPVAECGLTPERREFCRRYAAAKFGPTGMPDERLARLFTSAVTTHVLRATDPARGGAEVGLVTLYLEGSRAAFYYYAFYDLSHPNRSLGLWLMTSAVELLARHGVEHLYLGTCYSENARYKSQFAGFEFFTGVRWSADSTELKYLLARQSRSDSPAHLLEEEAYRQSFGAADLSRLAAQSLFRT